MNSDKNIEQKLEKLAGALGTRDTFINDVMNRIEDSPVQPGKKEAENIVLRRIIMKNSFKFTAAAIIVAAAFLSLTVWDKGVPDVMANELLTSAIEAVQDTHSIYIKARMRTLPQDNFMYLNLDLDFVPIEMWKKQCHDGQLRVRVDKPRRQVAFDNTMVTMIINRNYVCKGRHCGSYGSYDSRWLSRLLWVEDLLKNELELAQNSEKHDLLVYHDEVQGDKKLVVQRFSQADVSKGDHLRNNFIQDSDRTYFYYFDPATKLLEGLQILVHADEEDILVFEITDIAYNVEIGDTLFTLDIPEDAVFDKEPVILPDNEKYVKMTPKEAALAFFTACAEENWQEYLKFSPASRVTERTKQYLGGIEIISLGEPFQSEGYGGWFIPYEFKLKSGKIKKHNLAIRNDNPTKRWMVDGGI